MKKIEEFHQRRQQGNTLLNNTENKTIKRFLNLDTNVYSDGELSKKHKELLGLCASTVLRCNDCITYHLNQSQKAGASRKEIEESLAIALIVGGSITIPHLRYAEEILDELYESYGSD